MIELIKSREIDIVQLRKEKSEYISEQSLDFQLNEMLLSIIDEKKLNISKIYISRLDDKEPVEFDNATDADGDMRTIRCSNIEIAVEN